MEEEYYSCDIFEYYYGQKPTIGRNTHVISCDIYKLVKEVNEFIEQVAFENKKKGLKECNTKKAGTFNLTAHLTVTGYPPNEGITILGNKNEVFWNGQYSVDYIKRSFSDTDSLGNRRYGEVENLPDIRTYLIYQTMPKIKQLQLLGLDNGFLRRYPRLETEVVKDYKGTEYEVIQGSHWK